MKSWPKRNSRYERNFKNTFSGLFLNNFFMQASDMIALKVFSSLFFDLSGEKDLWHTAQIEKPKLQTQRAFESAKFYPFPSLRSLFKSPICTPRRAYFDFCALPQFHCTNIKNKRKILPQKPNLKLLHRRLSLWSLVERSKYAHTVLVEQSKDNEPFKRPLSRANPKQTLIYKARAQLISGGCEGRRRRRRHLSKRQTAFCPVRI
jgi:hypothetical protein